MTSITAPVGRGRHIGRPGIRGLVWNSWRTHRLSVLGLCALFAVCAVRIGITGIHTHAVYATYLRHNCLTALRPLCHPRLIDQMGDDSWISWYVPWLVGVFAGAPLLARDFETDAYRFSFVQGLGGRRQVVTTLLLGAALVLVLGCLLGLLTTWSVNPWHRIALGFDTGLSYWSASYFWVTAVTLPALSLVDFCVGVLAGALIRRVVPAMAAALVGALGLSLLVGTGFGNFLIFGPSGMGPAYRAMVQIAPLTAHPPPTTGPPGGLLLSWRYVDANGKDVPARILNRIAQHDWAHPLLLRSVLAAHHISYVVSYQPASRYWLFQAAAAAILTLLAAGLAAAGIWLATRRT